MSANARKTSTTNKLVHERNKAAADRTLMAWIRTAIAIETSSAKIVFNRAIEL